MAMFRLVSTAAFQSLAIEFQGENAASAIDVARRCRLEEADLWQEGRYLFTLRKLGCIDEWLIYRKGGVAVRMPAAVN